MTENILDAEHQYLSNLLEAIQRCVYFLLVGAALAANFKQIAAKAAPTVRCFVQIRLMDNPE